MENKKNEQELALIEEAYRLEHDFFDLDEIKTHMMDLAYALHVQILRYPEK